MQGAYQDAAVSGQDINERLAESISFKGMAGNCRRCIGNIFAEVSVSLQFESPAMPPTVQPNGGGRHFTLTSVSCRTGDRVFFWFAGLLQKLLDNGADITVWV